MSAQVLGARWSDSGSSPGRAGLPEFFALWCWLLKGESTSTLGDNPPSEEATSEIEVSDAHDGPGEVYVEEAVELYDARRSSTSPDCVEQVVVYDARRTSASECIELYDARRTSGSPSCTSPSAAQRFRHFADCLASPPCVDGIASWIENECLRTAGVDCWTDIFDA